jgi:catechol 2,3-dioxygenase
VEKLPPSLTERQTERPPIHADTTLGAVHLIVRDLEHAVKFYTEALGFQAVRHMGTAELSADGVAALLVLHENPEAHRPPARSTGLYHVAIRVPSRRELARLLAHMVETGTRLGGASDHLVSEALYLNDPEGNGLEFYSDRPRETWPRFGHDIRMDILPLDLDMLMAEAPAPDAAWTGLPADTVVGHVHLRVSDLRAADGFYQGVLGFERTAVIAGQAGFVSAGGYHHHLGYNVWTSKGAAPPPPDSSGLDYITIVLPSTEALQTLTEHIHDAAVPLELTTDGICLRDPSANRVLLTTRANS